VLIDGAGSGIFTDTQGTGAGGNIVVNADTVTLQNSGTLSAATSGTETSAKGGTITVNAPNSVAMTNGVHITASSTGPGNTGDIQITAGNQFAMTNSSVTTEATQSGGGVIKITTNPNGTVQLTDSTISTSVLDGNGGGGSVNIDPQSVVLINSQILANAVFGPGGNINITTNLLLPDSTSVISASSQFGQQGNIIIQSPISPASGKIIPLGQKPLIATTLLSQRCSALAGGNASSFTVAGRDSLPAEPGGWLSSPLALATAELVGSTTTEPKTRTSLSEATDAMPVVSLRRIAPPGFLIQNFAVDSTGCSS
jgi:large exoprotein involved in heme utilization and adhesion